MPNGPNDVTISRMYVYEKLEKLEKLLIGVRETQALIQADIGTLNEGIQELGERVLDMGRDYGDGFERYDTNSTR